jgi:hypothetical protein
MGVGFLLIPLSAARRLGVRMGFLGQRRGAGSVGRLLGLVGAAALAGLSAGFVVGLVEPRRWTRYLSARCSPRVDRSSSAPSDIAQRSAVSPAGASPRHPPRFRDPS